MQQKLAEVEASRARVVEEERRLKAAQEEKEEVSSHADKGYGVCIVWCFVS